MPPATAQVSTYRADDMAYPSRTIAFQAAGMITSIIENLQTQDELRYTPAFMYVSISFRGVNKILTPEQSIQLILGSHYARVPNAFFGTICCFRHTRTDSRLYERFEGRF